MPSASCDGMVRVVAAGGGMRRSGMALFDMRYNLRCNLKQRRQAHLKPHSDNLRRSTACNRSRTLTAHGCVHKTQRAEVANNRSGAARAGG